MASAIGYMTQVISFLHGGFRDAREGQDAEQLHFVPEGESHSVAWVLWHATRIEDLFFQQLFQSKPEIWAEGDYAAKTGLPEKGFGTGQTTAEARGMQIQDLAAFWEYQDAVHAASDSYLAGLTEADLEREIRLRDRTETLGESITLHLVMHLNGHRGEINLIRGMHGVPPVMLNRGG